MEKLSTTNADKEVAVRTKEVLIMKNKVFVIKSILNMPTPYGSKWDFHFDLQRFADNVTYLDANGTEQTVSDATILDGTQTTLNAGWYVVNSDLTINSVVTINGEVHLILADGAKLTINGYQNYGIYGDEGLDKLNIYCQSNQSGELVVTGATGYDAIWVSGGITINGGNITTNSNTYGIYTNKELTINGGKITDNSNNGISAYNFNLNWRNADDFIKTNKFESTNITTDDKIKISDGKRFYEENGNIYSGNITSEQLSYLETSEQKTLKPVDGYIVTIFDGVNLTGGNFTRIGTTNKYICAAGTELTLSVGDTTNFYKFNGIKGATADGNAYTYTVNGDSMIELDGFPKITGLTFNESGEYYEIGSTDVLIALATYVNDGHDCAGLTFKLTADLDFTDITFDGIGTATTAFKGTFSGDEQYSISNLTNCVFNYIDDGANISGLKVYGSNINKSCGIIVDNMLGGTISDCTVKNGGVALWGADYAGGIVGNGTGGSVTNCNALNLFLLATNMGAIVGQGSTSVIGCKYAGLLGNNLNNIGNSTEYFQLPAGATSDGDNFSVDGENYYVSGSIFTVDVNSSEYEKITGVKGATDNGDGTYTLTGKVTFDGYPKIDGLTFNDAENYYEISSADDLQALATYVNSYGQTTGLIFKQTADIDLKTIENFTPIGDYVNYCSFEGTFDGCGYKISNLKIDSSSNKVGLFRNVDGGTIQNVNLVNATVKGDSATYAGALVGFLSGTLENCSISGNISVSGQDYVGGLVGGLNTGGIINNILIDSANLSVSSQTNLNKTGSTVLDYIYNNQSYTVQNIYYHNFTSDIEPVYGKNITATTVYALNLPENVTASGALEFNGKYYAPSGATVTFSGVKEGYVINPVEITADTTINATLDTSDGKHYVYQTDDGYILADESNIGEYPDLTQVYTLTLNGVTASGGNPVTIGDTNYYFGNSTVNLSTKNGYTAENSAIINADTTISASLDTSDGKYYAFQDENGYTLAKTDNIGNYPELTQVYALTLRGVTVSGEKVVIDGDNIYAVDEITLEAKTGYNYTGDNSATIDTDETFSANFDTDPNNHYVLASDTSKFATAADVSDYPDLIKVWKVSGVDVSGDNIYTIDGETYVADGAEVTIGDRTFKISANSQFISAPYVDTDGTTKHGYAIKLTSATTTLTDGWYIVEDEVNLDLLKISGDVHIILADECELTVENRDATTAIEHPDYGKCGFGIFGESGATLNIYGQNYGTGKITANYIAGYDYEGYDKIGRKFGIYADNVNIYGGNVNVTSNEGIRAENGDIKVYNGTLTVTGTDATAISAKNVEIIGGTVTANGEGGIYAENDVKISGGTVNLTADGNAINANNVNISGGTVEATGELDGIYSCSDVNITGGKIKATGTHIGGPYDPYGIGISADYGNINLSWTNADDYVYANRYNRDITFNADFYNENGKFYANSGFMVELPAGVSIEGVPKIDDANKYIVPEGNYTLKLADGVAIKGSTTFAIDEDGYYEQFDAYYAVTPPNGYEILSKDTYDTYESDGKTYYLGEITFKPATGYTGDDIIREINAPYQELEGSTLTLDESKHYVYQTDDGYTLATAKNVADAKYPALIQAYAVENTSLTAGGDVYCVENGVAYVKTGGSVTIGDENYEVNADSAYVSYIDGTEQHTLAKILTGNETSLDSGWYVVNSDLEINNQLNFNGDTHLILVDGANLTVNGGDDGISVEGTLNIYGQTLGTGKLEANGFQNGIWTAGNYDDEDNLIGGNVNISGGTVTATGNIGINAGNDVNISGGQVTATSTNDDGIYAGNEINISGGQVTATSTYGDGINADEGNGKINLSWTNLTDFINASSYEGEITFAKRFYDESGNINQTSGKIYALDGYIVEIPDGVTINSDNATRIGTTNKYICAADAELTLSTGTNANFHKITGIKGATAENGTYTYSVTGDVTLELVGFPKIDGLNFDNDGEYYEISSVDDLQTFSSYVSDNHDCEGLTFKLTIDLDSTGDNFTAISGFKGTFDGNGHLIITDRAIFSGDTGTISGGYYYGTSGRGFTQVFKVNVPSDVAVNANSDDEVTFGGETYYKAGSNVTIDDKNYTINADNYYYVDENGKNRIAAAKILTADETTLAGGWYIVNSDLEINETLYFNGSANLILADGAKLTVNSENGGGGTGIDVSGTLNIYSQSGGTGNLEATGVGGDSNGYGDGYGIYAGGGDVNIYGGKITAEGDKGIYSSGGNVKIYDGTVEATGTYGDGIIASNGVNVYGGQVNATSTYGNGINADNVNIYGGQVTAKGTDYGIYSYNEKINLSWTKADDFIDASSYSKTPTFAKRFYDESGNINQTSGKIYALDGYIVEISDSVNLEGGTATRIGETNKYICAADAELTLSAKKTGYVVDNLITITDDTEIKASLDTANHYVFKDLVTYRLATPENTTDYPDLTQVYEVTMPNNVFAMGNTVIKDNGKTYAVGNVTFHGVKSGYVINPANIDQDTTIKASLDTSDGKYYVFGNETDGYTLATADNIDAYPDLTRVYVVTLPAGVNIASGIYATDGETTYAVGNVTFSNVKDGYAINSVEITADTEIKATLDTESGKYYVFGNATDGYTFATAENIGGYPDLTQAYEITAPEYFTISEITGGTAHGGKYYAPSGAITVKLSSADGIHRADENYTVNIANSDVTVEATGVYIQLDAEHANYTNAESNISIIGSSGDDSIVTSGEKVTIDGNGGNDTVSVAGGTVEIVDFNAGDEIQGLSGELTAENGDVIVDNVTIKGVSKYSEGETWSVKSDNSGISYVEQTIAGAAYENGAIKIKGTTSTATQIDIDGITDASAFTVDNYNQVEIDADKIADGGAILNSAAEKYIFIINNAQTTPKTFTLGDNVTNGLYNFADKMIINGGAGNDSIYNGNLFASGGSEVSIDGGAGNDEIYNFYSSNISIIGSAGNDTIFNSYNSNVTIDGGADDDEIITYGNGSINGGAGSNVIKIATGEDAITGIDSKLNGITIAAGGGSNEIIVGKDSVDAFTVEDFGADDAIKFANVAITSLTTTEGGIIADGVTISGINSLATGQKGWATAESGFAYQSWNTSGAKIDDGTIIYAAETAKTDDFIISGLKDGLTVEQVAAVIDIDGTQITIKDGTIFDTGKKITAPSGYTLKITDTSGHYAYQDGEVYKLATTTADYSNLIRVYAVTLPEGVNIASGIHAEDNETTYAVGNVTFSGVKDGYVINSANITADTTITATLDADTSKHYVFDSGNGTYTLATASNTNNYPNLTQVYVVTLPEGVNIASGTYATDNGTTYAAGNITFDGVKDGYVINSVEIIGDTAITPTLDTSKRYIFGTEGNYTLATADNVKTNNYPDLTQVYKVNLPSGTAVTGENYEINGDTYIKAGAEVTIGGQNFTIDGDKTYYIDADGKIGLATATILDGTETALDSGWYVVNSYLTINNKLNISGEVHLILADGAKLTINGGTDYGIYCAGTVDEYGVTTSSSLEIFGQSLGSGALNISNTATNKTAVQFDSGCNLTINGGKFTATSENYRAMHITDTLTINGGQITAESNGVGGYDIGAQNLTLGYRNSDDFISANSFSITNGVTIKSGQRFYDDSGNIYSGKLTSEQISYLAAHEGTTFKPLSGYVVTIPAGVMIESGTATKIGDTDKYICAANAVLTLSAKTGYVVENSITITGDTAINATLDTSNHYVFDNNGSYELATPANTTAYPDLTQVYEVTMPSGVTASGNIVITANNKTYAAGNVTFTGVKSGYVINSANITDNTEIKASLDTSDGKHYVFSNENGTYTLATASNTTAYPDLIRVYAVTLPAGVNITSGTYTTDNGTTYATGSITFSSEDDIKGLERGDGGNYTVNIESDVAFELVTITALTLTNSDASAMTLAADIGTVDGSARTKAIKIVGNELNNSILGGSGNDTLDGSAGDDTLTGNAGNDTFIYSGGKDIITDYGVGTDKISITSDYQSYSIDGNDLIFNFGENNSLTVKNAANTAITLNGASKKFTAEGVMTGTGTAITLNADVETYTADENLVTIDGSAVTGELKVVGNDKSNRIYAGKGNSTLIGGKGSDYLYGNDGADTFVYEHTEQEKISYTSVEGGGVEEVVSTIYSAGSDVIYNYSAGDKISLASGVELKDAYKQNDDVVVKVDSGTITVKDSADKSIKFVQGEEEITFSGDVFSKPDTSILPATFDAEVTLGATTKNLDASKRTAATKLTGNELNNSIVGGKSSDTLDGDDGNDTLTGGEGSDTFIYNNGKDVITDYGNGTDKIVTASNYQSYTIDNDDIIFNFDGENSLTVKNGVGKSLNINGVAKNFSADKTFNSNNTAVTLGATTTPFDATEFENLVTIDGSAVTSGLEVVGNAKANKIYAGTNGSTLDGGAGNDTLIGGAGADKFVYGVGNDVIDNYGAGDKISLASDVTITDFYKTNADLYIKFSAGSLTVKNTSSVTFEQDGKEFSYSDGKLIGGDSVTLPATFANEITLDSGMKNLDASKLTGATKLNGNDSANSIVGGKGADTLNGGLGDDTLTGGAGSDVFVYSGGKDVITDYAAGDKISLTSEHTGYTIDGDDIIFNFGGENSLTVKNGVGKSLNINGVAKNFSDKAIYNSNNTAVTLGTTTTPFDATEIETLVTIDGSAVTSTLKVVGNDKSNRIYAGKGGSTLNGGLGSDYLYGGAGSDVFVYEHHDQEKTTYTAEGASVSTIYTSGSDVIYNYEEGDKISLGADVVLKDAYKQNEDTIIKVDNGTITVKDSVDKAITIAQGEEEITFSDGVFVSGNNVSIPATFDSKFTLDTEKTNLDASMRSSAIKLTGNDKNNSIVGGKSSDTLDGGLGDDTLTGGAGSDVFVYSGGNDTITDYGTGSDKISIASGFTRESSVVSGDDWVLNFSDGGSMVLSGAKDKKITFATTSTTASVGTEDKFNSSKKTSVTLGTATTTFDATEYPNLVTINGSLVEGTLEVVGNDKANRIYAGNNGSTLNGGKGNDYLYGGDGADTLVYEHHDQEKITYTAEGASVSTIYTSGSDVIYNYEESDKISLASGVELKNAYKKNSDTIIKVDDGYITVKDSADKTIKFVQDGEEIIFSGDVFSKPDTSILPATFGAEVTLDAATKNLDASKRTAATKLVGNSGDNEIVGGTKNDTLDGGAGDDTLTGGLGSDVFIYSGGNDTITDYGTGSDKIIATEVKGYSIDGDDITFTFDDGTLKLEGAAEKSITINGVASKYSNNGTLNSKGTAITLKSDASTYTADADIVTIDGSQTTNAILIGNAKSNRFYGGTGSTFVYKGGSDIVYNYDSGDKISLGAENVLKDFYTKNSDVIFRVDSGYITIKGAADESITLEHGDKTFVYSNGELTNGETVILPATFNGEYTLSGKTNVDASKRTAATKLIGNNQANSIVGGTKNDTLDGGAGDDTLTGGLGNDTFIYSGGKDVITDYGVGTDKISTTSDFTSYLIDGEDIIFNFGGENSLKVQNGVGKSLNINGVAKNFTAEGIFNSKNTAVTLKSDATAYTATDSVVTIDGSQTNGVTVTGNIKNNRFYAGSGADVFVYEHNEYTVETVTADGVIEKTLHGSGSDIIYNYGDGDKISLGADVVLKNGYMKNADFVCRVDDGYITVKNASTVAFTQGDKDFEFNGEVFVGGDTVSIPATFVSEYNLDENAKNLNASMRTSAIKLVGNEKDNSIVGGTKNDTIYGGAGADSLWGGKGNDTLYGGDGSDTFIFQSGDGKDTILDFASDDMLKILDANGNAGTFSKASYGSGTLTLTVADSGGTIYIKNLTTETNININGEIYHVSGKTLTK